MPVICAGSYALIGLDDRTGKERWRYADPAVTVQLWVRAKLTPAPDGRAALYEVPGGRGGQVLLDAATGTVRTGRPTTRWSSGRTRGTPVLRRKVPGADARLVLRDLSTGAEHPLANTCPGLRESPGPVRRRGATGRDAHGGHPGVGRGRLPR